MSPMTHQCEKSFNDLLRYLYHNGYRLRLNGDALMVSPSDMPPDVAEAIRLHKRELVGWVMRSGGTWPGETRMKE